MLVNVKETGGLKKKRRSCGSVTDFCPLVKDKIPQSLIMYLLSAVQELCGWNIFFFTSC